MEVQAVRLPIRALTKGLAQLGKAMTEALLTVEMRVLAVAALAAWEAME
jgi:hypothetical protein